MPVKRELSPNPSEDDLPSSPVSSPPPKKEAETAVTPTKKSKTTPTKKAITTPKKNEAANSSSPVTSHVGSPDKKTGAWSGDELKMLYSIMCPRRIGVNWADVSREIPGRDAKSCNNKWARMQGKLMKAIEELGE